MTEHDRPTQSGTNSKAHKRKPSAHYEITSQASVSLRAISGLKLQRKTENVQRFLFSFGASYQKKKASPRANDDVEDSDRDDSQGQSKSSVKFVLFVAGYNGVPVHICWTGSSVVCWFDFSYKGGGLASKIRMFLRHGRMVDTVLIAHE